MEKSVMGLEQEKKILLIRRDTLEEAIESLGILFPEGADARVDSLIKEFEADVKKSWKTQKKIDKEITEIQDACGHNMEYDGHDSHNDYYKCTKCHYLR